MKKLRINLNIETTQNLFSVIRDYLTIVSPEYDLLWTNKSEMGEKGFKGNIKCYSYLYGQDSPCPGCAMTEFLQTGYPALSKVTLRYPFRSILVNFFPFKNTSNIFVHHQDITEATYNESLLETIFHSMPLGVVLTNEELIIQYASPGFFTLFPFIEVPVTGKDLRLTVSKYLPPFPKSLLDFFFSLQATREMSSGEFEISPPPEKFIEILTIPLRGGFPLELESGFLILFFDQTERVFRQSLEKRLEAQSVTDLLLTNLYKKLTPSLRELQHLSKEFLKKDHTQHKGMRMIQDLQSKTTLLLKQLEELNRYGKMGMGMALTQVNLHTLLRKTVDELAPLLDEKNIKVKFDLTHHLKPFAANKRKIQHVLNAIILNAVEGIFQKTELSEEEHFPLIEIKTRMQESDIELTIKDNGIGMEADKLNKIIQQSYIAMDTSQHAGMGLFLCQTTIRCLDGTIELSSVKGIGTKVTIKIPTISSTPGVKERGVILRKWPVKAKRNRTKFLKDIHVWILGEKDFAVEVIKKVVSKNGATFKIFQDVKSFSMHLAQDSPSIYVLNISNEKNALSFLSLLEDKHLLTKTLLITPEELISSFKGRLKYSGARFLKKPFPVESLMEALSTLKQ